MKQELQPIKRSKELVPLSKEHHEGLLLGWKIRHGLANGTEHRVIANYIGWFWENELREHFRKEEEVLVPQLPADNELVQQMFAEHIDIVSLVKRCSENGNEDLFRQLAQALNDHIRFEERVLFPFAEKTIPPDVLASVAERLHTPPTTSKWADAFWLRK